MILEEKREIKEMLENQGQKEKREIKEMLENPDQKEMLENPDQKEIKGILEDQRETEEILVLRE